VGQRLRPDCGDTVTCAYCGQPFSAQHPFVPGAGFPCAGITFGMQNSPIPECMLRGLQNQQGGQQRLFYEAVRKVRADQELEIHEVQV
jgi:hypothetical protein